MTILLTGCAGFIGSHLLDKLLAQNQTVVGVDDFNDYYSPTQKLANIATHRENLRFRLIKKDICQLTLNDLPSSFFLHPSSLSVIHLAARAGVRSSIKEPLLYEKVNVGGTLNMLEIARKLKVEQFIYGSSSSVYGNSTPAPFREDAPCDQPISPYGATKRAGELLCRTYSSLYHLPMTVLRFFTVYGPRNRPDMAMLKFIDALAKGLSIDVYGDSTSRDYTFVDDIVDGIVKTLSAPGLTGFGTFNLGNSSPVSLATLISVIQKVTGKKADIRHRPLPPGDVNQTYADITRAKDLLGWTPQTDIRAGIKLLWAWYQQQNAT